MTKQVLKKYSVAFKRHVVSEYEQGKSAYELKKRYGISGNGTVERWVREYGREGLRHQVMRIQHVDEQDRVKELEARVKELESALAQVTLDRLMYQAMVEVAERDHGLDLKKKSKPSHRTGQDAETRSQASAHSRGDLRMVRCQPTSALPASEARAGARTRSTGHL